MSQACPLNFEKVDSNISRISAVFVALLLGLYLYTNNIYILYFLAFDFTLKLFVKKCISPITLLAKGLKNSLGIQEKLVDGGAKRLAGFFGLLFVALLIMTHYLHVWNLSLAIAVIFLSCALLDVFFDFCIACKIYYIIKKVYPNFMNHL